jgi:glyoxylase-like metal-dependent hydrolase (beta-lactamase superfamily II)
MAVTKVAPGVWRAGTAFVNWYLVEDADGVTLIDGGLPGYRKQLDGALAAIGRDRSALRGIVLTHGHIDHIGLAAAVAGPAVPVLLHAADAGLAANPRTNRTDSSLLPYLRFPTTWAFLAHCVAQGATRPPAMPSSVAIEDGQVLDVPGRPVVTHAPGHTDGSCVLELRDHGVVFVGDLLCTVSPVTGRRAEPQLQTRGSNRSSDTAMASLDRLSGIRARVVLPGHGSPWRDGVEAAAASARRIGCR